MESLKIVELLARGTLRNTPIVSFRKLADPALNQSSDVTGREDLDPRIEGPQTSGNPISLGIYLSSVQVSSIVR